MINNDDSTRTDMNDVTGIKRAWRPTSIFVRALKSTVTRNSVILLYVVGERTETPPTFFERRCWKMLPVRKCGSQGFVCAAQGLGCMGMSGIYKGFESEEAQAEALRVFDAAVKRKDLMLDTSDIYGPHTNEELIKKATADKQGKFKIATKCGIVPTPDGGSLDSSPEYIKKACAASLERLGVDCIDLYYLHRYDQKTPIEESMRAFKELIEEGKIKYVGVSELSVPNLRKAHEVCPITAYQMEWSIFTRDAEKELIPVCRDLGIGIVAYSPLGRGMLTGAIKSKEDFAEGDWRLDNPRFKEHLDDNLALVEVVKEIAAARERTPGQVAIAWLHAQGEDVFPIPGTKRVERFEENVRAFQIKLEAEEMAKLNKIADKIKGDRYDEGHMAITFDAAQKKTE